MVTLKALSIKHPAKDLIGLVLSIYSNNLTEDTPLIDLAWLNSSLLHSSILKKKDKSLTLLKNQIGSINTDNTNNFTVHQGVGLIIGLHVLSTLNIYDNDEVLKFRKYFDKVSGADWFRVREVAALFCSTFKSHPGFDDLVTSAKAYLSKEFKKNHKPIGISLFGLSQTGNIDDFIDPTVEAIIRGLLSSKTKSVEELSYLCLALRESSYSNPKSEAFEKYQDLVSDQLYQVISENSEVMSLLLAILYISDSETSGERILERLNTSNLKEEVKRRVSEIIKSNDNLVINFKDAKPISPPIVKSLSIMLFTLSQIHLSNVFVFHPSLKEKVETFLETTQGKNFKVISKTNLLFLLIILDMVILISAVKYWYPLLNSTLQSIEKMTPGLLKSFVQSAAYALFFYPFYVAINFNIGMLKKGWIRMGELLATIVPETFKKIVKDLVRK